MTSSILTTNRYAWIIRCAPTEWRTYRRNCIATLPCTHYEATEICAAVHLLEVSSLIETNEIGCRVTVYDSVAKKPKKVRFEEGCQVKKFSISASPACIKDTKNVDMPTREAGEGNQKKKARSYLPQRMFYQLDCSVGHDIGTITRAFDQEIKSRIIGYQICKSNLYKLLFLASVAFYNALERTIIESQANPERAISLTPPPIRNHPLGFLMFKIMTELESLWGNDCDVLNAEKNTLLMEMDGLLNGDVAKGMISKFIVEQRCAITLGQEVAARELFLAG